MDNVNHVNKKRRHETTEERKKVTPSHMKSLVPFAGAIAALILVSHCVIYSVESPKNR